MPTLTLRRRRLALWLVLAAGFLLVNFHRTATAVLSDTLAATFDATAGELSLLHASFFYLYAALQLPAGLVVDRWGPRQVGAAGLAVMTAGVLAFAASPTLPAAFLARAVVGLGGSVLYIATLRFCASWFDADRYATMTGFTIAAAGVGGILATTPLALAVGAAGWRTAVLAAGAVGGVVAVGVGLFVRDTPTRAGYAPAEAAASVGDGAAETTQSLDTVLENTRTVLARLDTWLLGLVLFCTLGVNFTVLGLWGVPFVADVYGVSVAEASLYVLLGNVGFVLGSPGFGRLSDRLGSRTGLLFASSLLFTAVYAVLATVPPLPVVGLALFLALFANGGVALAFTVGKERHPPSVAGTVTGVINSIGYFGAAVFPGVMGAVLDTYWTGAVVDGARVYSVTGYRVAFGVAAVTGLVAALGALSLHRNRPAADPESAAAADD